MKIRSHLFVLIIGTLLPLMAFATITTIFLAERERTTLQRGATDRTLALITAVDAELQSSIATLQALATARHLDSDNLPAFHEDLRRVLASQPDWLAITLALPSGQQVVNTLRPVGAELPPVDERASLDRVLQTGKPAVRGIVPDQLTGQLDFGVRVPVIRGGVTKYVLSAIVKPQSMNELLSLQRLPPDWIGVVLDSSKRFVARTVGSERVMGQPASASLQEALEKGPEGWFYGTTLEGTVVYTAYNRSPVSGWTVAIGIPATVVEASARRTMWAMAAGGLGALALALVLAIALGRRITAPIVTLAAAAKAIGRGEPPAIFPVRVEEVGEVARALEEASAAVRAREEGERHARFEAEAANRTKDEFLATLSHELRTPLNAVYGWARMLQSGAYDGDKRAHALDVIMRNANAQVQLIDDLLDVSRIVTGKLRLDVRSVDLQAVIGAALDAVRPAALAKDLRLQTVLDPRVTGVTGDPDRLQQVVWNLLNNAVKFTPKGGRIQIHLQQVNSHVEIVVSDTGQGIDAETLPHIFERFRQADSTSTRTTAGLGLGLALVRHLVEAHGGTVTAESAGAGQGARFTVKLPLAATQRHPETADRAHPTARTVPRGSLPRLSLQGIRVLVVDDDRDSLDLIAAIFFEVGGEVRFATSAAEGFRLLEEWRPDVLISDIEMPGEDGYTLIRKVRGLDASRGGKTPAVALTAYGRIEDRVRTLSAGFSMHVPKPVDPAELLAIVMSLADKYPGKDV